MATDPTRRARRVRPASGWSLRTRVTLVASVVIAAAITGGMALIYFQQMNSVRRNVDAQVRTYVTQLALAAPAGDWPRPLPESPLAPSAEAQVVAADGTVLSATRNLTGVAATFALPPGSDTPVRLKGADGVVPHDVSVVAVHERAGGRLVTIVAAVPTGILSDVSTRFTSGLILGFPIVLVIAAAAVWTLVGRTLRPVTRIRRAVTDITSADLSRRVPEPGTTDEIGHLARTMNEMLDRLEDSARGQRRFVADASHELRSPLAAIRATLEVALAHPDLARWPAVADRAVEQTRRLENLTRDLLLLVKADAGTLAGHARTVDVAGLVREVVGSTAADVTIDLDLGEHAVVSGDPADLGRLFRNVLDNAVRYAETTVTVRVTAGPEPAGDVRVDVADDGPGVAAEDRDRVFDRFVRLDPSRDRASGNSGLGLAIAREIVTAHHGRIRFADPEGPHATSAGLLPAGPLHALGSQIVDQNGSPVRIASVGWFDNANDIPGNVSKIVSAGFNTVRLPWQNNTMSGDLGRFDQIVAAAGSAGLKVILDNHSNDGGGSCAAQQANGLWYDLGGASDGTNGCGTPGTVTDATFLADWRSVASHYRGNDTVIGYDLRNEPLGMPGQTTWGDGNPDTDIRSMYQRVGDAIQAVDPNKLIITEGRITCGGSNPYNTCATDMSNLADPSTRVILNVPNKVVYSVHEYPREISSSSPDSGSGYVTRMNNSWGYLVTRDIAPVWIGEMGSSMQSGDASGWAGTLVPYLNGQDGSRGGPTFSGNQQPISTSWWAWGNLTGEVPDGTLDSNGSRRPEQYTVYSQLQFSGSTGPACTTSANNSTVTTVGPTLCDSAHNVWAIAGDGTLTMNGTTAQYSANVIEIAYVNGTLWQQNASHLWWAYSTGTWTPTNGTTVSPV